MADSEKSRLPTFPESPLRKRLALALVAGVGLATAFQTLNWSGMAWIAPAVWLLCGMGRTGRERFLIGLAGGLGFYVPAVHWLRFIPYPVAPYIGWVALSVYLSLYPAAWLWICWRLFPDRSAAGSSKPETGLKQLVTKFFAIPWAARARWLLTCAMAWVAWEMLMARALTGFPFLLLGVSQQQVTPLIQIASIAGVHGVSFLVVWFSCGIAASILLLVHRPAKHWVWAAEIGLPGFAVFISVFFGTDRLAGYAAANDWDTKPGVRIALIQPSIPQTVKWDKEANQKAFQVILDLTEEAMVEKPEIVVWPEAALPKLLRYDQDTHAAVTGLAIRHKVWLFIGADDAEPVEAPDDEREAIFFNSAFAVSPQGQLTAQYNKRRLVMFGEYVPLSEWLPFLRMFSPVGNGFTPGKEPVWFETRAPHNLRVGPLICFEDIFSDLAREHVDENTDFLLNVTNDGWFGAGSQQWQHAANAAFRAVENGVPIVRCANNGISCWADEFGILRETAFADGRSEYAAGYRIVKLPRQRPESWPARTFYNRHGDWFGWGCVLVSLILAGHARLRRTAKD